MHALCLPVLHGRLDPPQPLYSHLILRADEAEHARAQSLLTVRHMTSSGYLPDPLGA